MITVVPLGLDRDAIGVSLARKAGLRARRADFRRIPANLKGQFGVVFSSEALHWTSAPPARFLHAAWFYRFLPAASRASFDRWGDTRFTEGLRGAAQLLEPGGAAVLQFGGRGQIQELFEAFDWALAHSRFQRYRGRLWYPTYYPNPRSLPRLLARAGLKADRVHIWNESLAERSPAETVAFVRAFTERTFLGALRASERELFYERLEARLRETGLRRIRWHRTLVIARKRR
jgi:SAM-dependent methyltransferase